MPNIMVEKNLLLVESLGSVGENQPMPPTYDVQSMHMHVLATHFSIVATSFVELEIH
jgi:hypothetical protein